MDPSAPVGDLESSPRATWLGASYAGAALVLALALAHTGAYSYPFDDSFITYRYARNVARGLGFVFNAGERVEGYTSFLWTVLLAGVARLGLPLMGASQLASIGLGLGMLALTHRFERGARAELGIKLGPWWLAASLWLAATGTWAYYAATGMETTLFGALIVLAGVLLVERRTISSRRALGVGIVLAASALTRPEGVGYAGCVVAALLLARADRATAWRVVVAFVVTFVPYFAWRYAYFGFVAPNTYYAKASPSSALLLQGAAYLEACLLGRGLLLPIGVLFVWTVREWDSRALRVSSAIVAGSLVNSLLVGGDAFFFYRFLLPAMPFAYVALAMALARGTSPGATWRTPAIAGALALALFGTELVPISTLSRARTQSDLQRARSNAQLTSDYLFVGNYLREHVRPGTLIAINAAGIVPFISDLPTLDMLGLTDAHIAHAPIELGHLALGHEKYDAAYVMSRRPALVLLGLPRLVPASHGPGDVKRFLADTIDGLPGDRALLERPDFRRDYVSRLLRTERGGLYVFLHRDARSSLR